MKRFRPYCPGYIVLYTLMLLTTADLVFTIVRQARGVNDPLSGFSMFSYIIFGMAALYTWQYIRAQVAFDGNRMRVAFPANVRPRDGEPRAMILYRQGDLDLRFIDKTIDLTTVTRYGYAKEMGYDRIDQSQGGDVSKIFPVKEVAFITNDNKRYHMNAAIYSPKQRKEIFRQVRAITGLEPEGTLEEVLR